MKNLRTLIKLQKQKVDEQRLVVARLQTQLDEVHRGQNALEEEKRKQEELVHKDPDLGMTYGDYISSYMFRRDEMAKKEQAILYSLELARDKLAELFEEQKRYEISLQNKLEEQAQEEKRRERIEMDEIGSQAHERKLKERRRRG